ncbi:MAG TPA: NADH-quinone oxidoreductase subunit NuoH [Candidatus Binatia bacterium]|nr:NADH-quinone oxidoreductase subunit NuoH [Candidatus Binatia bacterium]
MDVIGVIWQIILAIWNFIISPAFFIPLIFPGLLTLLVVLLGLIWFERKLTAKVQMRYGPLYILKALGGAIQMVADLTKYLFSEFIIPKDSDKKVFILAPILFFTFTMLPVVAIPISASFIAVHSDLTLLLVPAFGTLAPLTVILIGWASNNKYSFIGSLREGYMMISYEVPMFISVLAMALAYNSLDLITVVEKQTGIMWGIVINPLAAIVFFGALLMTSSRFPFDISEAESEIVVGPYTEDSGIFFIFCLGAPYVKLYVLSLFFSEVFLGGWNPLFWPINANPILSGLAVLVKAAIIMALCVFMRTVYARYRLDQALRLGWHKLFTLSIISVIISLVLVGLGVL